VHLTQIVNNSVTTVHLCEECAAEKGVQTAATVAKFPLSDFLATLGKETAGSPAANETERCAFCNGSLQDFRESGRLGCPHCYETFAPHLRNLLRRLHGSSQHVGEVYLSAAPVGDDPRRQLLDLREQLKRAVDAENFELAADLRDRIRVLE
jgi:protein arginine kinase activator